MKRILSIVVSIGMLVLVGCRPILSSVDPNDSTSIAEPTAGPTEVGISELADTSWVLVEIMWESPLEGAEITLDFSEDNISGRACNSYGGTYITSLQRVVTSDGTLTIRELYSTDMACLEPAGIMEQEQSYFNILAQISTYEIDDEGRLIIGNPLMDPCCLIFEPANNARNAASLDGTSWVLVSMNGTERIPDSEVTLSFSAGQVYGSAGCSTYSADYRGGEIQVISIGTMITSKMGCQGEDILAQEAAFTAVLSSMNSYMLDGNMLTLASSDGASHLVFQIDDGYVVSMTNLAGTEWILASLNGESPIEGTEPWLKFLDGTVVGSGGCNTFGGNYSNGQNGRIRIYDLGGTHERCTAPEGIVEWETIYTDTITRITSYQLVGSTLEMISEDGILLIFTAARLSDLLETDWWLT
ncbi:MAG: META domain-containing protein [Anaerolineae bacterium]|nr:META domain-containing protein [Anaerolineae bacterium]